jgi:SAM-dependent methyltransferase
MKCLYHEWAEYYDLCYSEKDYRKEVDFLLSLVKSNGLGKSVLDVGCGTGSHAKILYNKGFEVWGLDSSKELLDIAKRKNPKVKFILGNMRNFNLNKKFDIILCLFNTIHYNQNYAQIQKTLQNFKLYLKNRGVIIFEMGFNQERWEDGHIHLGHWSNKKVNLVRFSNTRKRGNYGFLDMAYILQKENKIYLKKEKHKMRIFETLKIENMLKDMGFVVKIFQGYKNKNWQENPKKTALFFCKKG